MITKGHWAVRKSLVPGSDISHIHSSADENIAAVTCDHDAAAIASLPDLIIAAQSVIERWETPLWKDTEPTASAIYRLRDVVNKILNVNIAN